MHSAEFYAIAISLAWAVAFLLGLRGLIALKGVIRRTSHRMPTCPRCGYVIAYLPSEVCPECGNNIGVAGLRVHYKRQVRNWTILWSFALALNLAAALFFNQTYTIPPQEFLNPDVYILEPLTQLHLATAVSLFKDKIKDGMIRVWITPSGTAAYIDVVISFEEGRLKSDLATNMSKADAELLRQTLSNEEIAELEAVLQVAARRRDFDCDAIKLHHFLCSPAIAVGFEEVRYYSFLRPIQFLLAVISWPCGFIWIRRVIRRQCLGMHGAIRESHTDK